LSGHGFMCISTGNKRASRHQQGMSTATKFLGAG